MAYLDSFHQVGRLLERIDHLAGVVTEDQELRAKSDIHTRGLHLIGFHRVKGQPAFGQEPPDGAVGEDHVARVTG